MKGFTPLLNKNKKENDKMIKKTITHGGYRDGAGRKHIDNPKKQRSIAATDDEWQQLKEIAKKNQQSISDYLITRGLKY